MPAASSSTTVESASFSPELILSLPFGMKPASVASRSRVSGSTRWRTSSWTSRSMCPSGETRSRRRRTVEHPVADLDPERLAGEDPAIELAHVGKDLR